MFWRFRARPDGRVVRQLHRARKGQLQSRFGNLNVQTPVSNVYNFPGGERAPSGDGGGTATAPTGPAGADTGAGGGRRQDTKRCRWLGYQTMSIFHMDAIVRPRL